MSILGIGTDIVEIRRIERLFQQYDKHFIKKLLADEESIQHSHWNGRMLAKRFCAKEAIAKALGTGFSGGICMPQIVIEHNKAGKPLIKLSGKAKQRFEAIRGKNMELSISDEKEYCIAFCTIEG